MSKTVLISIRPEWCKKILSGEKTVEIRKTRPKMETPFKVYIYCTKTAEGWLRTVPVQGWQRMDGFVIGEFTCYKIDTIQRMGIDNNFDYCYLSLNEFGNDDIAIEIQDVKKSCIPKSELNSYAKSAPELFAWHISDLKVYDTPRDLDEFSRFGFLLEWADQIAFAEIGVVKIMNRPTATWSRQLAKLKGALFIAHLKVGSTLRSFTHEHRQAV